MNADGLHITRHALERFQARWPGAKPEDYPAEMHRLLTLAVEEDLGYVKATRILNNGFRTARYFAAEGWRFVTDESASRLLTCERIIYRPPRCRPAVVTPKDRRRRRIAGK